MNRIAILAATAFAITTGCAEGTPELDVDALAATPFAGITPTLPVAQLNQVSVDGSNGPVDAAPQWAAADLPEGTYWMTVQAMHDAQGGVTMTEGMRQLVAVTVVDGVPMLHGMAPLYTNGVELSAQYVDEYRAPVEDGRCEVVTELLAEGRQTAPDQFEMDVVFANRVEGEDCFKMGLGEEQKELADFTATFDFIPPVIDEGKDDAAPDQGADPNANI